MTPLATTPRPPYFAVVFTSVRTEDDGEDYEVTAGRMLELASAQPGYLGVESVRGADGVGITVSYWDSLDAIRRWRQHLEHLGAQEQGRAKWYSAYRLRVCRVEYDSTFSHAD